MPYQPSETCGPDGPNPKMNRPPERASIVTPAIAAAPGPSAGTWKIAAPELDRLGLGGQVGEAR